MFFNANTLAHKLDCWMNVSKNDFFGSRSGGTIYSTNIYINPIAKFTDDNTPYEYTLYEFSEFVTIQGMNLLSY